MFLGCWKVWLSYINKNSKINKNFGSFLADFRFRAEGKKVTSRAELWLEPAWLGLITNNYIATNKRILSFSSYNWFFHHKVKTFFVKQSRLNNTRFFAVKNLYKLYTLCFGDCASFLFSIRKSKVHHLTRNFFTEP